MALSEINPFEIVIDNIYPHFSMRTDLNNVTYLLNFDWNERESTWYLQILSDDETPILMNIPLRVNRNLITYYEIESLPQGVLLLYDTSGQSLEADYEDLGQRCKLLYYQEA